MGVTNGLEIFCWGIAGEIAMAWILTIPATALVAAGIYGLIMWISTVV